VFGKPDRTHGGQSNIAEACHQFLEIEEEIQLYLKARVEPSDELLNRLHREWLSLLSRISKAPCSTRAEQSWKQAVAAELAEWVYECDDGDLAGLLSSLQADIVPGPPNDRSTIVRLTRTD